MHTKSFEQARTFLGQAEEILVVELVEATPQDNPRFLASTEYLIHLDLSSHIRVPLIWIVPRLHTKSLEQILRVLDEHSDEVLIDELLDPTPQERPLFLASTTNL